MTKITMKDRTHIVKCMMQDVHGKKIIDAASAVRKASEEAYKAYYAKDLNRMNRLPEGWLPVVKSIAAQFDGLRLYLSFNLSNCVHVSLSGHQTGFSVNAPKEATPLRDPITKRVPHSDCDHNSVRVNEGHEAFHAFQELLAAQAAFDTAKENLIQDANGVFTILKTMTTAEAVKKKWPEAAPYVSQALTGSAKSTALAPNFAELNKRLGLPVGHCKETAA